MKIKEIEEIFEMIETRFDFEFRNAESMEDLKNRIESAVSDIQNELTKEAK